MKSVTRYLLSSLTPHFANKSLGSSIQGHHWLRVPTSQEALVPMRAPYQTLRLRCPLPVVGAALNPGHQIENSTRLSFGYSDIIHVIEVYSFVFFYFPIANSQLFFSSGLIFEPTKGLYGFHFYQSSQRLGCHPN